MIRKNSPTPESTEFTAETGRISRRSAITIGISAITAFVASSELTRPAIAKIGEAVRPVAEKIGEAYDTLLSLETLLTPQAMIPLEPRETDTPIVEFQLHGKPIDVPTHFTHRDEATILHLGGDIPLRAEHTETPIEDTEFTAAGTAIITTAEGLQHGDQAYCQLFTGENSIVAVGYEGGLYTYEPRLGSKESQGEWVRIVATSDKDVRSSHAMSTAAWEDLESMKSDNSLIKDVVKGATELRGLGYKPFGAILASTQMPEMSEIYFGPKDCAQTLEEIIDRTKPFFVTGEGIVLDLHHLEAKAGETLGLYAQLLSQQISGEAHPTATVRYTEGSEATYTFAVEPASLTDDTIEHTTFAMMIWASTFMEGVSQRHAIENFPLLESMSSNSGMSHEDLFTNTLGISSMLALIKEPGRTEKISQSIQAIRRHYPSMPPEEISNIVVEELRPYLVSQVLEQTAQTYGIRAFNEPITGTLPRGIYPLVPVLVDLENTVAPTRITTLLREADIATNNPNVQFTITHATAYESTAEHVWKS